jgi:hypothetical protein
MTHLIIESEEDMERSIEYAMELARSKSKSKLRVSFPSKGMMNIFMSNLFIDFYKNDVPVNTGIDLTLSIPETHND